MITLSLQQAQQRLQAELVCSAADTVLATPFSGVAIDSRQVQPGHLFVALPGAQVDGHDYVAAAAEAGAAAALVTRVCDVALPQLVVQDTAQALALLARSWLLQHPVRVAAVTGSNGKTTVKNLLAGILAQVAPVLATPGNFNNELGLPLTLCQLDAAQRFAVLEMGARHRGDITALTEIARPQLGIVTNAGPAHLETFGGLEGVAAGKGEMFSQLPADGVAIINQDDAYADYWRDLAGSRRVLSFGRSQQADVHSACNGPDCLIHTPQGDVPVRLQLHGAHNVLNALAATAAALALDVPLAAIAKGLASVPAESGRLQYAHSDGGWDVIDDTYNANPASLYAALQTASAELAESATKQQLWLVLGDMGELGESARKLHAEMGEAARHFGVQRLWATGELSSAAVSAFGPGGQHFDDKQALIKALLPALSTEVRCLIKGSRSAGMEQVVNALLNPAPEAFSTVALPKERPNQEHNQGSTH
jgi:UDP-N-acetylmuramoyl-tripeptide--D-alanyl-D-alanine ligase